MARGNNYGSCTWSGKTIGGAVFGPAGPLVARTTYDMTVAIDCSTLLIRIA